jgi:hypothetical protein
MVKCPFVFPHLPHPKRIFCGDLAVGAEDTISVNLMRPQVTEIGIPIHISHLSDKKETGDVHR